MRKGNLVYLTVGLTLLTLALSGLVGIALAQEPAAVGEAMTEVPAVVSDLDGPLPQVEAAKAAKTLFEGIGQGVWLLICSGGGLVLIYLLRLLLIPNLTGKPLAITSTVLIAVAGSLTSLTAGADWVTAMGVGLSAGLVAGKAWDLIPDRITDAAKVPIKKRQKPK